jgi:hypothetical protein
MEALGAIFRKVFKTLEISPDFKFEVAAKY